MIPFYLLNNLITKIKEKRKKERLVKLINRVRKSIKEKKYLEDKWLKGPENIYRRYLKLFKKISPKPRSSIFDLGAGPGFLMWFAREFSKCGVYGLERFQREDFESLWDVLGLKNKMQIEKIEAFKKINFPGKFDYVLATGITFSRPSGQEWTLDKHLFFLRDVGEHLNKNGKLILRFNYIPPKHIAKLLSRLSSESQNLNYFVIDQEVLSFV